MPMANPPAYSSSFYASVRALHLILFLAAALAGKASAAPPLLRCELHQAGEIRTLDFVPVSDPYTVKPVDINGRFRFKAVYIGSERQIDYIKLYVYYQERRQWVLLHQAKYFPPFNPAMLPSASLTGTNYVYSPGLGRELKYGCALLGETP